MARNNFRPQKFYDVEIINAKSQLIGKIRVKPNGILWKSKGSHNWLGVDLKDFTDFVNKSGRKKHH